MTTKQNSHFGKGRVDAMDLNIGHRLKLRRRLLGLSQKDLADALRISVQQIQKYENAINRTSSSRLHILAELLNVPISYFFGTMDGPHAPELYKISENIALEVTEAEYKETLQLVKYYKSIKDSNLKQHILRMMSALSSYEVDITSEETQDSGSCILQ